MLRKPELFKDGFHLEHFNLPSEIKPLVLTEDWVNLDRVCNILTSPGGDLFNFVQTFHSFERIETMISVRDSKNEWEEDGIWHDDGSRVFAFSLSLTLNAQEIEGGNLGIREKGENHLSLIPTPEYGSIILFLTGIHGYEHKIHQVTKGKRIILVGWCLS